MAAGVLVIMQAMMTLVPGFLQKCVDIGLGGLEEHETTEGITYLVVGFLAVGGLSGSGICVAASGGNLLSGKDEIGYEIAQWNAVTTLPHHPGFQQVAFEVFGIWMRHDAPRGWRLHGGWYVVTFLHISPSSLPGCCQRDG